MSQPFAPSDAQILVLIAWAMAGVVLVGIGLLVRRALRAPPVDGNGIVLAFWLGWCAVVLGLQVWHLLLPIDVWARGACLVAAVAGFALMPLRSWPSLLRGAARSWLALLIFAAAAVWLSNHAVGGARFGDVGAYYMPTVRWLLEYPIVPGLGNLHGHYALNQSYFLYVAALEEGPFAGRSYHLANGLLVLALCARLALALARLIRLRRAAAAVDLFYALLLPGVLPIVTGLFLTSAAPDVAVFALGAVVSGELVSLMAGEARHADFGLLAIALLVATGITVKLSFAGMAVVMLPVAMRAWLWRMRPDGRRAVRAIGAIAGLGSLAMVPWIARNVVMSGCPFFPKKIFALPVEWLVQTDVEGWLRNTVYPGGWEVIYRAPAWYLGRLRSWGWTDPEVIGPLLVALLGLILAVVRKIAGMRSGRRLALPFAVLLPGLASLVYCLVLSPVPRYAGATVWVLAAGALVLAFGDVLLRPGSTMRPVALALVLAIGALELGRSTEPLWRPLQDFEPRSPVRWEEKQLETGLVLNVPVGVEACWDAPLPCTPFPNPALRLRREGELGAGFLVDPELNARYRYEPGGSAAR